ncbi:YceI family protein [Croceibacterium sp. TMG7-5b_MA50]|uniref:YceI family protein n=1 Tax=Croceibacterium sp. TMG7-5b_MA50 TaxID=3121290 RepID=UPI0032221326
MRKIILSTIAVATLSTGAIAGLQAQDAPALPGQMDASRVTAGTYTADSNHSLIGWRVNHFGFNDYFGIFGDVAGTLTIDPANLAAAKVDVTVPIANVTTASDGLTGHLLRPGKDGGKPDFFGAEPAPARFVSTSVQPTGETAATITGDLTMNGVTRPVTIAAQFTGAGANPMSQALTAGFEGTTTIRRSEFGIAGALPVVSDEVELDITIAFEKQ